MLPPGKVTEDDIFAWAGAHSWAPETRQARYVSLRGFYEWYSHKYGSDNPATNLQSARRVIPPPRPTPEDIYAQGIKESRTDRKKLILRLAGNLGLRADEISRVNAHDVVPDLFGHSLRVVGKGGTIRYLPLTTQMYEDILTQADPFTDWVFPGKIDGHISGSRISKIGAEAFPGKWTLHTLRHRFGTQAYRQDRDLIAVQRLLGHLQVSTTQRLSSLQKRQCVMRLKASAFNCQHLRQSWHRWHSQHLPRHCFHQYLSRLPLFSSPIYGDMYIFLLTKNSQERRRYDYCSMQPERRSW